MEKLTDKRAKEYAESIINKKVFKGKERDEITCMWFVNDKRHCKMTSLESCRGCRFYSPVMREKLRLLAEYGIECEQQAKDMSAKLRKADDTIADLQESINCLIVKNQWFQVSESLPEVGEMVLTRNIMKRCAVRRIDEKGAWFNCDGEFKNDGIVAWMPLPDFMEES